VGALLAEDGADNGGWEEEFEDYGGVVDAAGGVGRRTTAGDGEQGFGGLDYV
jgi:hypothetical protein